MARIPLQWAAGVNQYADPRAIDDNQLARATNAFPSLEGLLDKREPVLGVSCIKSVGLQPNIQIWPLTLFSPDSVLGIDFIMQWVWGPTDGSSNPLNFESLSALSFGQDIDVAADVVSSRMALINKSQSNTGNTPTGPASYTNYQGRTIAIWGESEGFYQLYFDVESGHPKWVKATFNWPSTVAGVATAQQQAVDVAPRLACSYRGRMVYANFGAGRGNWLVFADPVSATHTNVTTAPVWAIIGDDALSFNGKHLELAAIQGENITAMYEVSLMSTGSQVDSALLILTETSACLATGEPAWTTDSTFDDARGYIATFANHRFNYEVGCVGPGAICKTPYGLCWASKDDVWLMMGNSPMRIGTNIRPSLALCPASMRKWWSMAYANGVVYLAVCTQGSTDALNVTVQHWRLDLRQGPPQGAKDARWWGPQDYESLSSFAAFNSGNARMATGLMTKRIGDDTDRVYGSLAVDGYSSSYSTAMVTFNDGVGSVDLPFRTAFTGRAWTAEETVPVGDVIMPTIGNRNGRMYICTTPGRTAADEPTWTDVDADVIVDGTATWSEIQATTIPTRLPNYGNNPGLAGNLWDVWFKDLNFGNPNRDKLVRRADINAFFSQKARVDIQCAINGGDLMGRLGPAIMGGFNYVEGINDKMVHANNQLGSMKLDADALAYAFVSRVLRPTSVENQGGRADDTSIVNGDDSVVYKPGIIRGQNIQGRLHDGNGFAIDDSNDKLIFCEINDDGSIRSAPYVASVDHGYYEDMETLMTAVIAALNATGAIIFGNVSNWSYASAFAGAHPYFTTILVSWIGPRPGNIKVGFIFGRSNGPTTLNGVSDTVLYPVRCMRLLSLLGIDTGPEYTTQVGGWLNTFADGETAYLTGEQLNPVLADDDGSTKIHGIQVLTRWQSMTTSIASIELEYSVKAGLPMSKRGR